MQVSTLAAVRRMDHSEPNLRELASAAVEAATETISSWECPCRDCRPISEWTRLQRAGSTEIAQLRLNIGDAIGAPGVGNPHVGVTTGIESDSASDRKIASGIPGEAHSRHQ